MQRVMIAFVLFLTCYAQARTLVVSDVDDTIKVAHISSAVDSAAYALDAKTRFYGMSEVYQLLSIDQKEQTDFVYLSRAPEWLMGKTHRRFLKNGSFPEGTYVSRTTLPSETHKLTELRRIINEIRPEKVILIGDDTEQDAFVYKQTAQEFSKQGVEFYQFIHVVDGKKVLQPGQIAFVTSIDLAWDLQEENLLQMTSLEWVVENLLPSVLKPELIGDSKQIPIPSFVNCKNFSWKADREMKHNVSWARYETFLNRRCQGQ